METTNYSEFRQSMKQYLDAVIDSHTPLMITRTKGREVVVMSKEDYDSIEATLHLLRSPQNAARLLQSVNRFRSGDTGTSQDLVEP